MATPDLREAVMRLGKLMSVGEVADHAAIEEPAMGRPEPAQPAPGQETRNDDHSQVPAVAPTSH
jgi:hypothetical protein